MRIARFRLPDGHIAHGCVEGQRIDVLASFEGIRDWLDRGAPQSALRQISGTVALSEVRLIAPIPDPRKILGLGGNYRSHLEEIAHLGLAAPEHQVWFNKQTSCVAGPFDACVIPAMSTAIDFEGELGVVIGKRCRNVPAARAHEVIAGYLVCNDVSVRDVQLRSQTMTLGKSFDTHGPMGPWLITADEVADCQALKIKTLVNGEVRQDGCTDEMRWNVAEQIAYLSQIFTLEPGDVLETGTPAGVGAACRPSRFLVAGDVVRVEIDGLGAIENRFVRDTVENWPDGSESDAR